MARLNNGVSLFFIEGIIITGFLTIFKYAPEADARYVQNNFHLTLPTDQKNNLPIIYMLYQDVHVMIWIGFGFLMAFLRRYSQSAIGLTFLIAAVLVQVAILCQGVIYLTKHAAKAPLSLQSLLSADVAIAAPLISMGALLGKTTYMQVISMGILELIFYTINKYIGEHFFMAVDAGDSMYVHAFGAYFGLAVSFVFGLKDRPKEHPLEGSNYQSDMSAMIGTVFLWLFWPSFNSASLQGDDQQRAIINTLLAIAASCVIAFATSAALSKNNKFNMVHVQNSTLAGGVAVGAAAGMMCQPIGALLIGAIAGVISVFGYKYLTPIIQRVLRIQDTCGVHNLHGMPGVLAALFAALMAGLANLDEYGDSLYEVFPALIYQRTPGQQAGYQLLTLLVTLLIATVTGLITGFIIRLPMFGTIAEDQKFNDAANWELEESENEIKENEQCGNEQLSMSHI